MVNFLVAGDVGAASNLVRNIMLLSEDVDWPLKTSRFETIINQYPRRLKTNMQEWIDVEAKLGFFKRFYDVDPSHDLNWNDYKKYIKPTNKPAVFVNHSFVWELDNFKTFAKHMPSLIVMPTTDLGLEWQIRAYCEKKGVEIMHNFTFPNDVEKQKAQYIQDHGIEAWCRENIANMKTIIKDRRDHVINTVDNDIILPLEWLIGSHGLSAVDKIREYFDIDIDVDQATEVLTMWNSLHWPVEQTFNWKYA